MLPRLYRRCQTLGARDDAPGRYADEMQKVQHELKSIAYTLSAGLLEHICTTFYNIYLQGVLQRTGQVSHMAYDRQLNTPSMVQEIEALQAKLNATEDEDQQRALEEDITGKILWLCWCGICAEVDQLLPKVVDCIRREGSISGLEEIYLAMPSLTDLGDDQAHLRWIMFDAGVGTSKYQLLLDTRAAEQAKWSGATISRDATDTGTQGIIPSTNFQTPSSSVD
ncbi:hypothetical protein BKA82DRAFT_1008966 [Pisolithus tinctorius]|uniref:Uncharacterized protein n=1 Tax=Pisolithus tinctorius Marx 270 TaxID=870435 RepID=A0A0C3NC64_PISTI|nr:hypothetical protein BKA82DRAFT_1008966 [Pisolithus tinctorius]KIN93405.1 hypothetical protein M404DRAFT_1008966 [Pisolithus tinctorius Marx 270]